MRGLLPSRRGVNGQLRNRLTTIRCAQSSQHVQLVKGHVRLATYNLRMCVVGVEGRLKLAMLAGQLLDPSIGLYGLQELCWPGEGECDIHVKGAIGPCFGRAGT